MKRLTTTSIIALCTIGSVIAQPVISHTDFPPLNGFSTEFRNFNNGITPVSPENTGGNQIWDLSSIATTDSNYTFWGTPVSNAVFPNANSLMAQHVNGIDIQEYEQLNTEGLSSLGIHILNTPGVAYLIKEEPLLRFPLPLNYGDIYSEEGDEYQISKDTNGLNLNRTHYTRSYSINADGWGTLLTPFGIHDNVLRVKIIEESNAYSVWDWNGTNWEFSYTNTAPTSYESYYWLTNGIGVIAAVSATTNTIPQTQTTYSGILYKQNNATQINVEKDNIPIVIYPNPNNGHFMIEGVASPGSYIITISNVLGEQVFKQAISVHNGKLYAELTTDPIAAGTWYLMLSKDGKRMAIKQFTIL